MTIPVAAASPEQTAVVAELARRYLWWEPVGEAPHGFVRVVAQVMNLGGYDDILRLEESLGLPMLAEVMLQAEPGWLDARSWEFWRGRLTFRIGAELPEAPPRRRFVDAEMA